MRCEPGIVRASLSDHYELSTGNRLLISMFCVWGLLVVLSLSLVLLASVGGCRHCVVFYAAVAAS